MRLRRLWLVLLLAGCETPAEDPCATDGCSDVGGFVFDPSTNPDATGQPGSGLDTVAPVDTPEPDTAGPDTAGPDTAVGPDTLEPQDTVVAPDTFEPPDTVVPSDTVAPDDVFEPVDTFVAPDIAALDAIEPDVAVVELCGNGKLDEGEACDKAATGDAACPTQCVVLGGCTKTTLVGSASDCSAYCEASLETNPIDGDGCCPKSGTAQNDTDCITCGNGKLDSGETCDDSAVTKPCLDACAPSDGCNTFVLAGSPETCNVSCQAITITDIAPGDGCCPAGATPKTDSDCAATCGNGKIEPGEDCDGSNLGGKTCSVFGYPSGAAIPLCLNDCTLSSLPCGGHFLEYEAIPNIAIVDDFTRVKWHPTGDMAILLGAGGKVVKYDPATHSVALALTLAGRATDLEVHPDGGYYLVIGTTTDGKTAKVWRLDIDLQSLNPTATDTGVALTGTPAAIQHTRDPNYFYFVIGTNALVSGSYQNRMYLYEDGLIDSKAYAGSAGLQGLMWVPASSGIYSTSPAVIATEGVNGTGSRTWIIDSNIDLPNNWPGSYGNAGNAEWRPGGKYGIAAATSTGGVYVFNNGAWTMTYLAGMGSAATSIAVSWRQDGSRAIVLARPILNTAKVYDHRPKGPGPYDQATWTEVSLPSFNGAPFNATSNSTLNDADWRPNSLCDEGLIAASDNGTSFNPTLGLLMRYYDADDPDCAPTP